jgi:hypothetical protein
MLLPIHRTLLSTLSPLILLNFYGLLAYSREGKDTTIEDSHNFLQLSFIASTYG